MIEKGKIVIEGSIEVRTTKTLEFLGEMINKHSLNDNETTMCIEWIDSLKKDLNNLFKVKKCYELIEWKYLYLLENTTQKTLIKLSSEELARIK